MINTLDAEAKAHYKITLPDSDNLDAQFRIEPSLKGFLFAKFSMGNRFFRALRFDAFKFSGGLVESANLATVTGQVIDTGYSSDYKQILSLSGGLASDSDALFNLLNINVAAVGISENLALYTSPQLLSAAADTDSFSIGDTVTFDIKLKPNTLDYLSLTSNEPYNIDDIIIYRKIDDGTGSITTSEIDRTTANFAQSDFTVTWDADFGGTINGNFFAFVDTKALRIPFIQGIDLPFLDELELGAVTAEDSKKIAFMSNRDGDVEISVMNADGSAQVNLTQNAADDDH